MSLQNDIWVIERDQVMMEGEKITWAIRYIDADAISVPSSKVYKNGNDYSSTVQTGSDTVSGTVQYLKTIEAQANDGGSVYVVVASATVDGNTEKRKFLIRIVDPSDES